MFKIKYLEDYYNMAMNEFGTSVTYSSQQSDMDFICMLKDKFRSCYIKSSSKFILKGRRVDIQDLKTYLRNKIYICDNDFKYSNMPLIVLYITVIITAITNMIPEKINNSIRIITLLFVIIVIILIIPWSDSLSKDVNKSKGNISGFYRLSLDILEQVEREGEKKVNDEQIKEITIAAINNKLIAKYDTEEKTAEEIVKFINKLKQEINK